MGLSRETIDRRDAARLARSMARRLTGFEARALVYLGHGGRIPGLALADELGLPACELDIRYPVSRMLDSAPAWLRPALLAIKELAYRATAPGPAPLAGDGLPEPGTRMILLDDSASSGRTIRAALRALAVQGIPRECIRVVVLRCGRNARSLVDHYALASRVRFSK